MTAGGADGDALARLLSRVRRPRVDPDSAARIKRWTREALALPEDAGVTVSEVDCADPACPGLETVIVVTAPGRPTQAFKARDSALVQTRPLIEAALKAG